MAQIRTPLINDEFYHIFNRGIARQPVFLSNKDYRQAITALSYYMFSTPPMKLSRLKELSKENQQKIVLSLRKQKKRVEIICFVLMPNHFHFLLKQNEENGISEFISQFSNSYTRYFNTLNERSGPIFQGVFKSVHIETDEQLVHLSRYIHINPATSSVVKNSDIYSYPWSSLISYLDKDSTYINFNPIINQFPSIQRYKDFLEDQLDYSKELRRIKHLILER